MTKLKRGYIFLGYDPATGKEMRKWVSGKSDREVEQKKRKLAMAYGRGDLAAKDIVFREFSQSWLNATHPQHKTNTNTYRMYAGAVTKLNERFGSMKLSRIRQIMIEEYLGSRPPHSARIERIVIRNLMSKARKNHYIGEDPAEDIKLVGVTKKKKRDLEPFEREAIRQADLSPKERAFVMLCLRCGLSRGEALALTPECITHRVRVKRSVIIDNTEMSVKDMPKRPWRVRSIPIPADAIDDIQLYAATVPPGELLFGSFHRRRYWKFWRHILSRVNDAAGGKSHFDESKRYRVIDERKLLEPFSAHILRHAYCCDLYRAGYRPGEVMRLMGHSNIRMSIDVYEHIVADKITASRLDVKKIKRRKLPVIANPSVARALHKILLKHRKPA